MKQYLLVDCMSDWKELGNQKDIKDLLIEEVSEDIFNNLTEREIVVENVKLLSKLAKDNMTLREIEQELECYSFKVIDLLELQRDLEDVKNWFFDKDKYVGNISETIDEINKEVNGK